MGGIAYNYRYVSDQFNCLKTLDGFLMEMIKKPTYLLSPTDIATLSKISFFGFVRHKKQGKFTKKKASQISKVWNNV